MTVIYTLEWDLLCWFWLWSHIFCLYTTPHAFNVQTSKDLHLNKVSGQVRVMTVGNGMIFAGTSVSILVSSRFLLVLVLCFFVDSKVNYFSAAR